ncbi:hypothetical protein AB0O95_12695 [Rhodoglobus sp. NPDC076762]
MIDKLLRPKIAFWTGVALTLASLIVFNFLLPTLYLALEGINFPMTQQFVGVLTSGLDTIGQLARMFGPLLIVGALIMLKIERSSGVSPRS